MPPIYHTPQGTLDTSYPLQQMLTQGPPPGYNPMRQGGRIPARWTMPFAGLGQPLLEMPQNRFVRISLGTNAWLGEPILNNASKLTTYMALEKMVLTTTSHSDIVEDFVPDTWKERLLAEYGADNPGKVNAAYVKQQCLEMAVNLDIKAVFQDEMLDSLIAGDGFVNIASSAYPQEESWVEGCRDPVEKMRRAKILSKYLEENRGGYHIEALQSLNPSAVWIYPDYAGRIVDCHVVNLMGEGQWEVPVQNLIQIKGGGFGWTIYGVCYYIAALKWVDVKFKMMDALSSAAGRYVNPLTWLSITGPKTAEGANLPPTKDQMAWAEEIIWAYSQDLRYIMPDGWKWEMLGAEGKVLDIAGPSGLVEYIDDNIRTSSGTSKTFTSGGANVPAYATSKLQGGLFYKVLQNPQDRIARAVESLFARFCAMRGFYDSKTAELIAPKVEFMVLPIQGDDSVEKKIATLAAVNAVSKQTIQEWEGLDPALEADRIAMEAEGLSEPFRAIAPDIGPVGQPQRFDNFVEELRQALENNGDLPFSSQLRHAYEQRQLLGMVGRHLEHLARQGWPDDPHEAHQQVARLTEQWGDIGRYLSRATLLSHQLYSAAADNDINGSEERALERAQETDELLKERSGAGDAVLRAGDTKRIVRNTQRRFDTNRYQHAVNGNSVKVVI